LQILTKLLLKQNTGVGTVLPSQAWKSQLENPDFFSPQGRFCLDVRTEFLLL